MTTLRAGDLVRFIDQAQGTQEMTVTQTSGSTAHCAWFDADGDHTFRAIPADELETTVEAHRRAKTMQERARNAIEAEQMAANEAQAAAFAKDEAANIAHNANEAAE